MSIPGKCILGVAAALFAGQGSLAGPATRCAAPESRVSAAPGPGASSRDSRRALDCSGRTQRGKASYYARKFAGRTMADGTPMNPDSNAAASRTLPLGTRAKVTNVENGRSAVVEIRDRGPYVEGRTIDVSPKVAEQIGLLEDGVATVEVTPLELPVADGR
jgi:rare lipoprotein A